MEEKKDDDYELKIEEGSNESITRSQMEGSEDDLYSLDRTSEIDRWRSSKVYHACRYFA